jgi:hypothetical protein
MKQLIYVLILLALIFFISSIDMRADEKKAGIGFILGEPCGITGKFFFDETHTIDLGFGAVIDDGYYVYGDYLRHFDNAMPLKNLSIYFGLGPGLHHHDSDHYRKHDDHHNDFEIRVPIGVEYTFSKVPLGAFVELVPALIIIPHIDFEFRGGIGMRYYF